MKLEEMIDWSRVKLLGADYSVSLSTSHVGGVDKTLDDLIHVNTRILRTKRDAITEAIRARLKIRTDNLVRISEDREKIDTMLQQISVAANYHLRDPREKDRLYQRAFDLQRERRDQDADCWKDIVLVLRDFLSFWDEYERASARGAFLQDV